MVSQRTTDQSSLVRSLSQYRPFERGGANAREAQEDLVLSCLAELGGASESAAALRDDIQAFASIDLHQAEVDRAAGQLIKDGRIEQGAGGTLRLTQQEQVRLAEVAAESRRVEEIALDQWRRYTAERWPRLSPDHLDMLVDQLGLYLLQVLRRHGVEATMLLYPEDTRTSELYEALESDGFDFLPAVPPWMTEIRSAAFSQFIRNPSEEQRLFLGECLNTSYFLTLLSIDPEAAELVREVASGQWVYLDTNFIYRVLGVQGPRYVRAARTILETTKSVGYKLCVTPWTVAEFKYSLDRARKHVRRFPIPASEYAELLADTTSDEDFVTAYWRAAGRGPLNINDFFAYWSEVEVHLERHGIVVRSEGCNKVEARTESINDEMSVFGRAFHGGYRPPEVIEHDVRHRLLIRQLRGDGTRTFANGGYWFLTFDSVLPRYDHFAQAGEPSKSLPFCVAAGAWFQLIEAFRPKTDDMLQSLADLLASPYARYRRDVSKDTAQSVVSRVQMHEGADPELAARVMMNSFIMSEIEKAPPGSEEQIERIDNAIVEAARQAREDAKLAQAEAEAQRDRAHQTELDAAERVRRAELDKEQAVSAVDAAARNAEEARRLQYDRERREDQEKHDREMREMLAEQKRLKRRLRAGGATVAVAVLATVGVLALGFDKFWQVLLVIALIAGLWAALDQLWIGRADE